MNSQRPLTEDVARSWIRRQMYVFGKRRNFIVDRSQVRPALLATFVALVPIVLFNISMLYAKGQSIAPLLLESPELAPLLRSQNNVETLLTFAASLVFLAAVFVISILETHKTAGAAMHLAATATTLQSGDLSARSSLRRDDNLRNVEQAINALGEALQRRADEDGRSALAFAERAAALAGPDEATRLAEDLRGWAALRAPSSANRQARQPLAAVAGSTTPAS